MAITPPLIPNDDDFNELANRLAAKLSSAFGYSLPDAEEHIRNFYIEYEQSAPQRRKVLKDKGVQEDLAWSAAELFWHDDVALVLLIGYRLAGGNTNTLEFLDWRTACWDALKSDQRVPDPRFYEDALIERLRAMRAAKAQPAEVVSNLVNTIPEDVSRGRLPVLLKVAFSELPYDVVTEVGALAGDGRKQSEARINQMLRRWFQ